VDKVRRMVEGTRHVKRSATVTETFEAITPRMLSVAAKGNGELVSIAALSGSRELSKPSSSAVSVVGGLKTRQKEVGFQVLVGAAQTLEPSLQIGATGAILGFADPAPTACYEIYAAWKEGDADLARLKQQRIIKAARRIVGELGIPAIKYAMDLNGYYGGPARLPLLPITADVKEEVERLLSDIRN
jgi:4-hydroxy-2-oxoglutarate aldolase